MIGWNDIYKVVTATVPLYVPLAFGYGSVKWWHMFNAEQCDTINRLTCYFILPFFTFDFVAHVDPYEMNFRFIAGDVIAKFIIGVILILWANLSSKGSFSWSITSFSLANLNSTLVMGVPLLKAMYDQMGADLAIQSFVIQSLLWYPALLFMLEYWSRKSNDQLAIDLEENSTITPNPRPAGIGFWTLIKIVVVKVLQNPNCYTCILGLVWALLANRWNFEMPTVVEGSIQIMSKAGIGISMFSIGLFIALQEKVLACGSVVTLFAMVLRFLVGPATVAIGCFIVGIRGDVLNIVIIQAALPQAVPCFVFAKEYGLHANIISTSVVFGTLVSLPIVIAYYAVMEIIN